MIDKWSEKILSINDFYENNLNICIGKTINEIYYIMKTIERKNKLKNIYVEIK